MELIGLYLVACGLLVAAGAAKAVRPDDTARALAAAIPFRLRLRLRLQTTRKLVRVGSAAEAALGLVALALPRPWSAGLVALSFAAFAAFVAVARSNGGAIASCGCFGTTDTPATLVHVVINIILALTAAVIAGSAPPGNLLTVLAHQPADGVPLVAVSVLAGWLAYLAISVLAGLQAARALTGVTFDRHGSGS